MSTAPVIKVTLAHNSGATSGYKPGASCNAATHGGLREAIVTCFAPYGDFTQRVELLRADIFGGDFAVVDRAGAIPELEARLNDCAADLLDGHEPHVVITLSDQRQMVDAHLVTNSTALAAELQDGNKRSLVVPRILPYQLGGSAEGVTALLYKPANGGPLRIHSMHPTLSEVGVAEADLKSRGEMTGLLPVHTPVTKLLAAVARGEFKAAPPAQTEPTSAHAEDTARRHPGLHVSPLEMKPSPFGQAT